jgi:hypothetical protein
VILRQQPRNPAISRAHRAIAKLRRAVICTQAINSPQLQYGGGIPPTAAERQPQSVPCPPPSSARWIGRHEDGSGRSAALGTGKEFLAEFERRISAAGVWVIVQGKSCL